MKALQFICKTRYNKKGIIKINMIKKKVEQLVKIIGKGNLLEFLYIFLGVFQHASLNDEIRRIDNRNHNYLFALIQKSKEPLDDYFSLKLSLQGLFLIYTKAYMILKENNKLNTQDVIDKIYGMIKESDLWEDEYNKKSKLDLLNILANPIGELTFNIEKDFEDKVLIEVKKLLKNANIISNEYDKIFVLEKCVIDRFYFIHQDIKLDKSIVLLLSTCHNYRRLSKYNKNLIKKEILPIVEDHTLFSYIECLTKMVQNIDLVNENEVNKYTLDYEGINKQNRSLNMLRELNKGKGFMYPKSIGTPLKQLLKKQVSKKFEKTIMTPKNIGYLALQEENKYINTTYKLILGVFLLSCGLCIIDYLFIAQKLSPVIKNVLPQDNLTNLVIFTVSIILIVPVLFQLYKSKIPECASKIPEHTMNFVDIEENFVGIEEIS